MNLSKIKSERLIAYIKKPIVVVFGVLIFTLSSVITITNGISVLGDIMNKSVAHNQSLYRKLDQLTTETNIKYFD